MTWGASLAHSGNAMVADATGSQLVLCGASVAVTHLGTHNVTFLVVVFHNQTVRIQKSDVSSSLTFAHLTLRGGRKGEIVTAYASKIK